MQDRHVPSAIVAALVAATMVTSTATAEAAPISSTASIEVGIDSFAQSYQLTDFSSDGLLEPALRDTSEVVTEFRAAANFGLRRRGDLWRLGLDSRVSAGTDLHRAAIDLDLDRRGERTRLEIDLRSNARVFREGADYRLSSDNGEVRLRTRWLATLGSGWSLGLQGRAEMLRYESQSAYQRDAHTGEAAVVARWERGWSSYADLELGAGRRSVPDSTAIAHRRLYVRGLVSGRPSESWQLGLESLVERRRYDDAAVRSAFTSVVLQPDVEFRIDDHYSLRWESPVEWFDFDEADEVYFDFFLGRSRFEVVRRAGSLELGLGPSIALLRTPETREDEYVQWGAVVRLDWYRDDRVWVSLSEELGRRDHREVDAAEFAIYSDYWFLRTSVVAGVRIRDRWSVEAFVADEPESHRRAEDDSRLTLVSASLRYRF